MTKRAILSLSVAVVGAATLALYRLSVQAEAAPLPLVAALPAAAQIGEPPRAGPDSLVGVFEGRTACGVIATEFTGFPAENCEKIKWRVTLYRDPATGNPTTYAFLALPVPFKGTRATWQGEWRIERVIGTDGKRVLYHLDNGGSRRVLSLLAVDDNVLLFLDRELKVLVGDASWSYVLNRTNFPSR